MSGIYDNLDLANILLDVSVTSKKRALEYAAQMFENSVGIARSVIYEGFFSREKLGSTALGHGIAVPHTRLAGIHRSYVGVMRLAEPIVYVTPDKQPVQLLVFLITPEKHTQNHLEFLATLAKTLSQQDLRDKLFSAKTALDIKSIFKTS